jgi:signal transduction histidine kinase
MPLQPTDLALIVREVLAQLEPELRQRQIQVTVEEPLPQVIGNRVILGQVVTNLLTNAIKFVATNVQPEVRVWSQEIRPRGSMEASGAEGEVFTNISQENASSASVAPTLWIRLWVDDNGIGIAPENHKRIFNVFDRLHGSEVYPGTGIGLAIVRKGVERMGGRVGVESQLGQGSRFWIELLQPSKTYDEPRG